MGVGRGGISYLFLTGIQDGESRPKDFCVTCRLFSCARHSREMDLLSPRRREEKNQFAGAAERHDTPRRDRGVRMAG